MQRVRPRLGTEGSWVVWGRGNDQDAFRALKTGVPFGTSPSPAPRTLTHTIIAKPGSPIELFDPVTMG